MLLLTRKDRPSGVVAQVQATQAALRSRRRFHYAVSFAVLASIPLLSTAICMGGGEDAAGAAFGIGVVVFVIGLGIVMTVRSRLQEVQRKVDFFAEVADELLEDAHPAGKIHYHLDLRPHDATDKRVWSGTSRHGNAKHRYDDWWFRMKVHLSDGTVVVIARRTEVKTRKGGVMKNKRRLYLKVFPNPKTFGPGPYRSDDLEQIVKRTVQDTFRNPPEGLRIDREDSQGGGVELKVTQLDAEFFGREVHALIESVLLTLRMSA